jgi:hypothetical protein
MSEKFENLRRFIVDVDKIPQSNNLFAGANLIITDDPNRNRKEHDVLVVTRYAKELSWFVFQLKEIFSNNIDFMNKDAFYFEIGTHLNRAISNELQLKDQLIYVINSIENI